MKLETNTFSNNFTPDMSRRRFLVAAGTFAAAFAAGPLMGAVSRDSYAAFLKSDPSLRGYWRFDGDLTDMLGKAHAKASGSVSYVSGATEGKALNLVPHEPIMVANTNHLRGKSASLELFFKVNAKPTGDADPVLIAQTAGQSARYIVGIKNDLSALLYRNEKAGVVTEISLPTDEGIEIGRWYHLVITSFDLDVRAYVDGYECSLFGGAYEFTRRGPKKTTLTLGSTTVKGWGSADLSVDEVACYARGLTLSEIQEHLKAAGWSKKLEKTGALVASVKARRDAYRDKKAQAILNDPALVEHGSTHVYEGENLGAIDFIVGGIGAGGIQFNGNAEPAIWQIACNFTEEVMPDTFLAVRAQAEGAQPVVRALQTQPVGAFAPMSSLKFEGEYPFAKYLFEESALPVEMDLEVFNPFIPMDLKNSGIPCAIYTVTAKNNSRKTVKVDILAAQKNALGFNEGKGGKFGKNQNELLQEGDTTLLHMTRKGVSGSDMVLMTSAQQVTGSAEWNSNKELHSAFNTAGACEGPAKSGVSANGQTVNGALSAPLELAPGESKSVTYVLSWYFEGGKHGLGKAIMLEGEGKAQGPAWSSRGQNYTNWWPSAMGVASYLKENLEELTARTRLFHDTFYASTLPVWLLDRITSQLAVLRSQTCWWAANGYFGVWEGCNPDDGCCAGNCAHVWHYAQGHARVFPELGRLMRDQDYRMQINDGLMPNRHNSRADAADGQFGGILNTYREYLCSPDDTWLKSQWPNIKRAMDWGISHYNPSRDGFLEAVQHNTLDGAMGGCSSWIGSMYLTALEATARMADVMGDPAAAAEYRRIRESGKKLQNERLWEEEYYVQEVGEKRIQDYLDGCHIDQLLGEWWADQLGIDRNYPLDRAHKAMESLLKYNFLTDFHGHSLKPRQYCEIDDGGMKMITWPRGPQPIPGMKYGDEVMTGFEYGAAVSLMQNGMLKEGLMVIKVISDRYNGRLRTKGVSNVRNGPWGYSGNPFGDDECGKFYGRSLSVWSALTALQGFIYDGPAGRIGFRPLLKPEQHASFFTVAEGYGLYWQAQDQQEMQASLDMREGQVRLNEVILAAPTGRQAKSARVSIGEQVVQARLEVKGSDLRLVFSRSFVLKANQTLELQVKLA